MDYSNEIWHAYVIFTAESISAVTFQKLW